jgi:protein phosphatase 2C family protein 2/3
MTVNDDVYIINVGDSRAIASKNNGAIGLDLSKDHKPSDPVEFKRIESAGGHIYQTHSVINSNGQPCLQQIRVSAPPEEKYMMDNPLVGPYRVYPGRLSVCRTFGDLEAKHPQVGGNPNVVICDPDINY